jgi:hypothetical protein
VWDALVDRSDLYLLLIVHASILVFFLPTWRYKSPPTRSIEMLESLACQVNRLLSARPSMPCVVDELTLIWFFGSRTPVLALRCSLATYYYCYLRSGRCVAVLVLLICSPGCLISECTAPTLLYCMILFEERRLVISSTLSLRTYHCSIC